MTNFRWQLWSHWCYKIKNDSQKIVVLSQRYIVSFFKTISKVIFKVLTWYIYEVCCIGNKLLWIQSLNLYCIFRPEYGCCAACLLVKICFLPYSPFSLLLLRQSCHIGKSENPCRIFKDFSMLQLCLMFSFLLAKKMIKQFSQGIFMNALVPDLPHLDHLVTL